jgi:MFS family permease
VWIILLPILLLVFRNRPEDVGQKLDGLPLNRNLATPNIVPAVNEPDPDEISFNLRAAQRTRAYWIMMATQTLWALIATAIFFNLLPLFSSKGLTDAQAAATYTTLAIATVITQLIAGALADRTPLNWLLSLSLFSMIGSILVIIFGSQVWLGAAYAILMGMTQGFGGVVGGTLWARYYGREHLGKIRGSIFTAGVAGSSIGPFIMGLLYDNTGSYQTSLWLFVVMLIPVAVAALWATQPKSGN